MKIREKTVTILVALAVVFATLAQITVTVSAASGDKITSYRCDEIKIDGKLDDDWNDAASVTAKTVGTSNTTATIKTLYGSNGVYGNQNNKTLYILIEVDKHGTAVNSTDDTVWVAINLACIDADSRLGTTFGVGVFGASPSGATATQYGWFNELHSNEWKVATQTVSEDRWRAEFAIDIIGANQSYSAERPYQKGDGTNGFGIGSEIGLAVAVQDNSSKFWPSSYKGAVWGGTTKSEVCHCGGRVVIDGELPEHINPVLNPLTTYKCESEIVIDGETDEAWSEAQTSGMTTIGNSKTTATIKTLYGDTGINGKTDSKVLYILVTVDKHGVEVTSDDTVWVAINLLASSEDCRYEKGFGLGIIGMTPSGATENGYGWFYSQSRDNWSADFLQLDDDRWVAEFAINIVDANLQTKPYMHGNADNFGDGTKIGLAVAVQDDSQALFPSTMQGQAWGATGVNTFIYAKNRVLISEAKHVNVTLKSGNGQTFLPTEPSDLVFVYNNVSKDALNEVKIDGTMLSSDRFTYDASTFTLKISSDYLKIISDGGNHTLSVAFSLSPTVDIVFRTDYFYGDINGDLRINGNDLTALMRYLAEWKTEVKLPNADCNGDGKYTGKDAIRLAKYLAEWDVSLGI